MRNLTGVQLGYTNNGNQYRKTNTGKKAGTIAGAVAGGALISVTDRALCSAAAKINTNKIETAVELIKKTAKTAGDTVCISGIKDVKPSAIKTLAEKVVTSSKGRLALTAGVVAGAIIAGKALGSVVDAGINKIKQFKADKQAEQKEAVIKEYEASKAD